MAKYLGKTIAKDEEAKTGHTDDQDDQEEGNDVETAEQTEVS